MVIKWLKTGDESLRAAARAAARADAWADAEAAAEAAARDDAWDAAEDAQNVWLENEALKLLNETNLIMCFPNDTDHAAIKKAEGGK